MVYRPLLKKVPKSFLWIMLFITFPHFQVWTQNISGSFIHNGINREYFYYLPANYNPEVTTPLILNLHGHTSNNTQQQLYTDFEPIADTAGFIMVFPQGTNSVYSGMPFWNYDIFLETADDLGFLNALIDTISSHLMIDASRIYCTGMSNGGFMSYFMALYSDRFAAVASVTGSMAKTENGIPPTPIPIMEIHGDADGAVPYNGDITMRPIEQVVEMWVDWNHCNPTPTITNVPNSNTTDGATAEHYLYQNGVNGNTVEFYKIIGGGHTWPGTPIPLITNGNTCMDFSASEEIWRFFSQYSRTELLNTKKEKDFSFVFFPNPANSVVSIMTQQLKYEGVLYDIQGKRIRQFESEGFMTILDVSGLDTGIYLLEIDGVQKKMVIH